MNIILIGTYLSQPPFDTKAHSYKKAIVVDSSTPIGIALAKLLVGFDSVEILIEEPPHD